MGYEDPASWTPLQRAMALSTAHFTGKLPHPMDPKPVVTHKLVTVRSLVNNRYHNGRCVQVGDTIELPAPEGAGWVRLKWAEIVHR